MNIEKNEKSFNQAEGDIKNEAKTLKSFGDILYDVRYCDKIKDASIKAFILYLSYRQINKNDFLNVITSDEFLSKAAKIYDDKTLDEKAHEAVELLTDKFFKTDVDTMRKARRVGKFIMTTHYGENNEKNR